MSTEPRTHEMSSSDGPSPTTPKIDLLEDGPRAGDQGEASDTAPAEADPDEAETASGEAASGQAETSAEPSQDGESDQSASNDSDDDKSDDDRSDDEAIDDEKAGDLPGELLLLGRDIGRCSSRIEDLREMLVTEREHEGLPLKKGREEVLVSLGRELKESLVQLQDRLAQIPKVSRWAELWKSLAIVSTLCWLFLVGLSFHPAGRLELAKLWMSERQEMAFEVTLRFIEKNERERRQADAQDAPKDAETGSP